MKNAIVTCVTPNWLAPAAVTLLSCAQQGASNFAELIIISFDTSEVDHFNLAVFNCLHETKIKLLNISPDELVGIGSGRLGVGSLLRLKLDAFLPDNHERVLYLDSDVLAVDDCREIFAVDLEGMPFAAVESIAMLPCVKKNAPKHLQVIGTSPDHRYFNAGVMMFDWKLTKESGLLPKSLDLLKQNPQWPFQDQDVLNRVAGTNWKMLDHKWNVTKKTADYLALGANLRHFNGSVKPWNSRLRFGFATYSKYYSDSLKRTGWAEFVEQPQKPYPFKDNWRAILRSFSFLTILKLKNHIGLVADKGQNLENAALVHG